MVKSDAGYGGMSDVLVDLRVDDHATPLAELGRLYRLHELYFGRTPEAEWVGADEVLAAELRERLAGLGFKQERLEEAFSAWAGVENLEGRVKGIERIDPVVLAELRRR